MPTEREALIVALRNQGMEDAAVVATEMLSPKAARARDVEIPNAQDTGALTVDDVKRMTPEQINERWDEVAAVMSGQA